MALLRPDAPFPRNRSPGAGPRIDRFGALISIVVLMAAATAVFVLRQNLNDHLYRLASGTRTAETTGAALPNR